MTEPSKERLLAHLADARNEAAKADEQVERQQGFIDDLRSCGSDTVNAMIALKELESIRDLQYCRIETILTQLDHAYEGRS